MSDVYNFDSDGSGPPVTDAERRRLLLERLRQAANTAPGQTTIANTPAPQSVQSAAPPSAPGSMLQALREALSAVSKRLVAGS